MMMSLLCCHKTMDPLLTKELLQDIEKANKTRCKFDLLGLCNKKDSIYGAEASSKRRSIQKKFDLLKRKTPENYLKYLDKFEVSPSAALLRELRESKSGNKVKTSSKGRRKDDSSSSSSSSSSSDSSSSSSIASSKPSSKPKNSFPVDEISAILKKTGIGKSKTPVKTKSLTPNRVKKSKMFSPSASVASPTQSVREDSIVFVLAQVEQLANMRVNGSLEYPYIQHVNVDWPERNNGFEVSFVPSIVHRGYDRAAFVIRKVVALPQNDEWTAIVPHKRFPSLASRSILIRGPSQDFWHESAERYHANTANIDCENTKKVHTALETAISKDENRKYSYWLVVFPEDVVLENYVFSDDDTHITKHTNDMADEFKNDDDDLDIYGMSIYWRIAVSGGELVNPVGAAKKKFEFKKK